MQDEHFEGPGGVELYARSWRPDGETRAVAVIVHGFKAHGGLQTWAGEEMSSRGIAAYALDLRGHGRSGGERYKVGSMADYIEDVRRTIELARDNHPGRPIFLLGHSAGGVIACTFALEHQDMIAGLISESFAHEIPAPDFALAVIKGVSKIAPNAHILKLKDEDFSRDPAFVERMKNDPLIPRFGYPAHTVAELVRADERLKRDFRLLTLPVLILHGTDDRVTKPHGSQRFFKLSGSSDKTLRLYEGHYHDLLNDVDRDRVLADIVEWIRARSRN